MKYISNIIPLLLFVIICTTSSVLAASFSADMSITEDGKTETVKFYLTGSYYRMEKTEAGKSIIIIVDREKKIHSVLNIAEKTFYEMSSVNKMLFSKDPFLLSDYIVSQYKAKVEGPEMINGVMCEKQDVPSDRYARWFSKELNFPLRIVLYDGDKEKSVIELKNIKQGNVSKEIFTVPADFKKTDDPGTAARGEQEVKANKEKQLPGLTGTGSDTVPCRVKIAVGGELRVPVDTQRQGYLRIFNETDGQSIITVSEYKNGEPREGFEPKPATMEGKGRYKEWEFNDDFWKDNPSRLADEIRIKVDKGLIHAYLRQKGPDHTDFYNKGGQQADGDVDPERPLTVNITGDDSSKSQTTGRYWFKYKDGSKSEAIPFTVENGKTITSDYPSNKGIKRVAVSIREGDGRAKVSLIQPEIKGYYDSPISKQSSHTVTLSNDRADPIYKKCTSQTERPGPWCYQEEVKKSGDPALCENIIKYWPKATGVYGQCYYELARKKMDCELCERIKDKHIKKMCELDVCK